MDQKSELILHNIDQTRSSLAEKIELLEDQVKGKVENAKATVEETIDGIKQKVETTVDNVKQNLSLTHQVQLRPWTMIGASIATGLVMGSLLARDRNPYRYRPGLEASDLNRLNVPPAPVFPRRPSFLSRMAEEFKPEIATIKGIAISMAANQIGESVKKKFPNLADAVDEVIDSSNKFHSAKKTIS